jgi:arsenate reductase
MLTVYHYPACSTCKKAIKWLKDRDVQHTLVHIVDSPPSKKILSTILKETGLPVRKLFNTSGQLYREGAYKEKLETMNEKEAINELASHGKLIKRPLVIGSGVHLVGFKEDEYKAALR